MPIITRKHGFGRYVGFENSSLLQIRFPFFIEVRKRFEILLHADLAFLHVNLGNWQRLLEETTSPRHYRDLNGIENEMLCKIDSGI